MAGTRPAMTVEAAHFTPPADPGTMSRAVPKPAAVFFFRRGWLFSRDKINIITG